MGFMDDESRGPVTIVFLRAEDLHSECPALQSAIEHRKKGKIGEFYPLFVLNPDAEGSAGSDLIYRAWKLGLKLQDDTGWNLRVEFRRGRPEMELEVYSGELQAARVYCMDASDGADAAVLKKLTAACEKKDLVLTCFSEDGTAKVTGSGARQKEKPGARKKTTSRASGARKKAPAKATGKKTDSPSKASEKKGSRKGRAAS